MRLSLIVAVAENQVIGGNGKLLWRLPNDLQYFRRLTESKPVIMGRKTFESIGHPLPNRPNIVISRQPHLKIEGCTVSGSLEEALVAAGDTGAKEVFVIGGGEIYREALGQADRIYLTRVHGLFEGDVTFPSLSQDEWEEVSREEHFPDERHLHAYTFLVYERRR